ncbi:MAG: glycosyltransferase family 39 protein [bacterium]|nr:glycosyltransferase family 39 protein [bacterium]
MILFGFKAGIRSFWGRHGGSRRAEVSREMVVSGNWAVPHLNGEAFITKPPLYYWSAALVFRLRGKFDEFGARLPSMLAAGVGVLITYFWASMLFSAQAGLFAGIILASSFMYAGMARSAEVDMMLTLFSTAALYFFSAGYLRRSGDFQQNQRWIKSRGMYVLATVCIALGTLTKHPIGLVVPLIAIALFILLTRDVKLILETKPWWLALLFLLLVLPWFVVVSQHVPNFFEILHQETLGRYTNPGGTPHLEPFYYYIPALAAFAPWILFLPGLFIRLFKAENRSKISKGHLLVLCAFFGGFLLFSSVSSKREYYLLPLYPFLAILTAKYWDGYLTQGQGSGTHWSRKGIEIPLLAFAGLICLIGTALPVATLRFLPQYLPLSILFSLLFLFCGILLFKAFFQKRPLQSFSLFTIATVLLYVGVLMTVVPEMDRYRSRKAFLQEAAALVDGHQVIDYRYESYELPFYMQRIVPVVTSSDELRDVIAREHLLYMIMRPNHYEELRQDAPELIEESDIVLERRWQSATNPRRSRRLLLLKYEQRRP